MSLQTGNISRKAGPEGMQEKHVRNIAETGPGDSQKHLRRLHGALLHAQVRVIHTYVNMATFLTTNYWLWKLYFVYIPIPNRTYFFLYCTSSFSCHLFRVQKQHCNDTILLTRPYAGLPDYTVSSLMAGTMVFPVSILTRYCARKRVDIC